MPINSKFKQHARLRGRQTTRKWGTYFHCSGDGGAAALPCLAYDDGPTPVVLIDEDGACGENQKRQHTHLQSHQDHQTGDRLPPFEAKRKLFNSYDRFFADKRVVLLLRKLLGKQFSKKKKLPVPLDLKRKNWKEQIMKVCGSALLYMETGTCSVLKVGKVSMGAEEIVENVAAAVNGIAEIVPRKWRNIRSLQLKLSDSMTLPVYQAVPDMKLKIDGIKEEEEEVM
ncbi:hypothetical protein LWI29_015187 [Acer saccharum]|uniref:Uncharacterized protein n=1 Tax=Acer saccharum TaxID=4024 RepID=A0AA39SCS4_ACESA|nr:hypothetical protein LWI29_015187 [Acer saccharum]